jgi:hypothetical protein
MATSKPGLFRGGFASNGTRNSRRGRGGFVPLSVSLPFTVVISLGLWAGIFLVIKALF